MYLRALCVCTSQGGQKIIRLETGLPQSTRVDPPHEADMQAPIPALPLHLTLLLGHNHYGDRKGCHDPMDISHNHDWTWPTQWLSLVQSHTNKTLNLGNPLIGLGYRFHWMLNVPCPKYLGPEVFQVLDSLHICNETPGRWNLSPNMKFGSVSHTPLCILCKSMHIYLCWLWTVAVTHGILFVLSVVVWTESAPQAHRAWHCW